MPTPLGLLEVRTLTHSMLALDAVEKAGDCRVLQAELNDLLGLIIKITGSLEGVKSGLAAAKRVIEKFKGEILTHVIPSPTEAAWPGIWGPAEYSPLMESNVVFFPSFEPVNAAGAKPVVNSGGSAGASPSQLSSQASSSQSSSSQSKDSHMSQLSTGAKPQSGSVAIGFIETQGYTAVIEAIDTACKAANVEVLGREKLGGGYITVVIKGDVAAVEAAVQAGQAKVGALGKLIASHVIARPSEGVLGLLPKA